LDDTDRRVAVESEIRDRQAEMDDIEARIQQLEGRVDEADERDEPDEPDGRDEVDQRDGDGDGAQRDQLMDEVMQLRDSLVQQQDSIGDGRQQLADLDNQKEDALQQVRGRISDLRDQSFNFTLFTADGTPENEAQLLRRISGTDPGEVVGRAVCRSGVADVSCTVDGSSRLGDLVQAEWDAVGQGLGGVVVGESVLFETTDGETAEIDIVMSRDLRAEANSEIALDAITRAALLLTLLLGGITWFAVGWALRPTGCSRLRIGNANLCRTPPTNCEARSRPLKQRSRWPPQIPTEPTGITPHQSCRRRTYDWPPWSTTFCCWPASMNSRSWAASPRLTSMNCA